MACRYRVVFLIFVVTGFSAGSGCDGDSPQTPAPAEQTPPGACSGAEGDECAELTAITASVDQRSDIVPKEVRDDVVVFDFPELGANGERPDILMDGRIVAGGVTRAGTPFLRKIESCIIDKARKEIVCQTSVPRLEETFENVTISRRLRVRKDGHLPSNKPDSHDSLLSIGTSFDCAFDLVDETREGENGQTTIYIGLPNCEIAVGLDLILNLEIKRAKLQSAEIALEGSLGLDIDALASIDASYEWGEEKLLGGVTLANITFAIGIVPVNIQITFDTYAGYNATFDGLASVEAGVDALYTAKFGVAYDGTDWNKIGEVKAETTPWKNVTLETEVTAGLWIRPEFSVLLYGTMGPTLSAKASLTGSFKADNCEMVGTTGGDVAKAGYEYTVDLGLDIEMGGKIEFLSWEKSFDLQLAS